MLTPGQVVAGRYAIGSRARAGGMGAMFRADDLRGGGAVAVKVVEIEDDLDAARWGREVAGLAGLHHPGIVRYVEHGALEGRARYLVMEWIEGESAAARLAGAGMTAREAVLAGAGAAAALAHAHRHGLVHRDVKPDNLMVRAAPGAVGEAPGSVVLVDFGVARPLAPEMSLTRTGAIVGTPGYLAPEQARGDRSIDARADAFALGCTLYECLSGRRAFGGTSVPAVLVKALLSEPEPLMRAAPALAAEVAALVHALLAKEPAARPGDLDAVAAELRRLAPPPGGAAVRGAAGSAAATVRGPHAVALVAPQPGEGGLSIEAARAAVDGIAGASVARLRDGALALTAAAAASRPAEAAALAAAALALRAVFPRALVALAAGGDATDAAGRLIEAAAIDAAVAPEDRTPPIELDRAAADLLRGTFQVRSEGGRAGQPSFVLLPVSPSPC
jgi:hypothetical protein